MGAAGGGVVALVLIPHFVSWKVLQVVPTVPVACASLYLALHSCMVSALADEPHIQSAVTITRLRIIIMDCLLRLEA